MASEWIRRLYGVKLVSVCEIPNSQVDCEDEVSIKSVWDRRPRWLRFDAAAQKGDGTLIETVTNVATSLPFIVIGLQAPRKKPVDRQYADSLVGVGLASSIFHISRGKARKYFRWFDYMMIAASTVCLSRALQGDNSKMVCLASAVLLPFQPFVVSAFHTGLMEATFLRRAAEQPQLRKAHALHAASLLAGGFLFVAEDVYPDTPYLHAGWHVAAAVGVTTCNQLLN